MGERRKQPVHLISHLDVRGSLQTLKTRDLQMLEAINCTLCSLTESTAVKQQDHITSYCQYLEHELRAMEQIDPQYFRFVQGEIGRLIYNPRSPNHPYSVLIIHTKFPNNIT